MEDDERKEYLDWTELLLYLSRAAYSTVSRTVRTPRRASSCST